MQSVKPLASANGYASASRGKTLALRARSTPIGQGRMKAMSDATGQAPRRLAKKCHDDVAIIHIWCFAADRAVALPRRMGNDQVAARSKKSS
jgi:hypothetical protein